MKRKKLKTKRKFVVLLFPLILILSAIVAYGAWRDYVRLNLGLTTTTKPTIEVNTILLNAPNNIVTIIVNSTTKTVENTDPNPLQILINVTNTSATPITKLAINDTLPTDWNLTQQPLMQLVETDGNTTLVDPTHCTVIYDSTTKTLIISVPDIKTATGKFLTQNETILISFSITYNLIGNQLPPEYENDPPTCTNTATAIALITSWESQPTTSISPFITDIYWI